MTTPPGTQSPVASPWAWPISRERYDTTPFFSDAERLELDRMIQFRRLPQHNSALRFQRVLQPITDLLDMTGCVPPNRYQVVNITVRIMHQVGAPFWAWSEANWTTMIGDTYNAFYSQYPCAGNARQYLMALAYIFGEITDLRRFGTVHYYAFARKVFGGQRVQDALEQISAILLGWGYSPRRVQDQIPLSLCRLLLANRSPVPMALTSALLETTRGQLESPVQCKDFVAISRALVELGAMTQPLLPLGTKASPPMVVKDVDPEWFEWCQRWHSRTTLAPISSDGRYKIMVRIGRWLAQNHPGVRSPADWTRELAGEFVAAIQQATIGQWAAAEYPFRVGLVGKPLAPRTKNHMLSSLRLFLRDCQEWGWIPRRLDPSRSLRTPSSIIALIGPDPQVIADDVWAKLLWAGLNLTQDDRPTLRMKAAPGQQRGVSWYPLEMMRAMVLVWLFCGVRSDEFHRLRLGCIRWHTGATESTNAQGTTEPTLSCLLHIPVNKTGTAFTKPVDRIVGEAIEQWEKVRPPQPGILDRKTGEIVHFLFSYRGYRVANTYINKTLIPMLCQKAGVPTRDVRGPISSHRARSTIATQLYNAKEPLSLYELQQWLGHRSLYSTQHYAKISPTRLTKAFQKAGYFERNLRTIDVLIDQDAIMRGAAAEGEPWKYYDLGHGYCTYTFFDQCPHRMACAKCGFYRPKGTSQESLVEGKANLQRMLQVIPLTDDERAAVEDGIVAMEKLCERLRETPTPAGPTPSQLVNKQRQALPMLPAAVRHQSDPSENAPHEQNLPNPTHPQRGEDDVF